MASSQQPASFDPYHKWLGIRPNERPASHYRLLGVAEFEDDPDVIDAAADRQMSYVQQCASGENLDASQKILNELSTARVELLNPQTKAAYDAKLQAAKEEASAPKIVTEPRDSRRRKGGSRGSKSARTTTKRKKSTPPVALIGGIGVAVVGLAVVLVMVMNGGEDDAQPSITAKTNKPGKSPDPPREEKTVKTQQVASTTPSPRPLAPEPQTPPRDPVQPPAKPSSSSAGETELGELAKEVLERRGGDENFAQHIRVFTNTRADRDDRVRAFRALATDLDEDLLRLAKATVLTPGTDNDVAKVSLAYCRMHFGDRSEMRELAIEAAPTGSSEVAGQCMKFLVDNSPPDDAETAGVAKLVLRSKVHRDAKERAFHFLLKSFSDDSEFVSLALIYAKLEPGERGAAALKFLAENARENAEVVALMKSISENEKAHRFQKRIADEFFVIAPTAKPSTVDVKPIERSEVPAEADVREAKPSVRNVLKDDFAAAKTPAQQASLAKKLATQSADESDLTTKYVLLREAIEQAVDSGDPQLVLQGVGLLGTTFVIDDVAERRTALTAVARNIKDPRLLPGFAQLLVNEGRKALQVEKFDDAERFLESASAAARRVRDVSLTRAIAKVRGEAKVFQADFRQYERSQETLSTDPTNTVALMQVAEYICVRRGDWSAGLEQLSKVEDASLQELLVQQAAQPAATEDQVKLADDWWGWITASGNSSRTWMLTLPVDWYSEALPSIQGLDHTRIKNRLSNAEKMPALQKTVLAIPAAPHLTYLAFNADRYIRTEFKFNGRHPIVLEAVVEPLDAKSSQAIVADVHGAGLGLYIQGGRYTFAVRDADDYVRVSANMPPELGVREHLAGVFDGKSVSLYRNGNLEATSEMKSRIKLSPYKFMIGADPNGYGGAQGKIRGRIYEVRILNSEKNPGMRFGNRSILRTPRNKALELLYLNLTPDVEYKK